MWMLQKLKSMLGKTHVTVCNELMSRSHIVLIHVSLQHLVFGLIKDTEQKDVCKTNSEVAELRVEET